MGASRSSNPRPINKMRKKISLNDPKRIARYLFNASLAYLARRSASSARMTRLLKMKLARRAPEADAGLIPPVIARLAALGLINDRAYANMKAHSLRRCGGSTSIIKARLRRDGLDTEIILAALKETAEDTEAAIIRARRKRLGAYASPPRPANDRRDLAAMMRAGFSYDTARNALEAPPPDPDSF